MGIGVALHVTIRSPVWDPVGEVAEDVGLNRWIGTFVHGNGCRGVGDM
jgi:hypothetical protein